MDDSHQYNLTISDTEVLPVSRGVMPPVGQSSSPYGRYRLGLGYVNYSLHPDGAGTEAVSLDEIIVGQFGFRSV